LYFCVSTAFLLVALKDLSNNITIQERIISHLFFCGDIRWFIRVYSGLFGFIGEVYLKVYSDLFGFIGEVYLKVY